MVNAAGILGDRQYKVPQNAGFLHLFALQQAAAFSRKMQEKSGFFFRFSYCTFHRCGVE